MNAIVGFLRLRRWPEYQLSLCLCVVAVSACAEELLYRECLCSVSPTPAPMVFKARDHEGQVWAVKRVRANTQSIREAERLARLRHPLVVPLHSIFEDDNITYLQMPFYEKGDLRTWMEHIKVSQLNLHPVMCRTPLWMMHKTLVYVRCIRPV